MLLVGLLASTIIIVIIYLATLSRSHESLVTRLDVNNSSDPVGESTMDAATSGSLFVPSTASNVTLFIPPYAKATLAIIAGLLVVASVAVGLYFAIYANPASPRQVESHVEEQPKNIRKVAGDDDQRNIIQVGLALLACVVIPVITYIILQYCCRNRSKPCGDTFSELPHHNPGDQYVAINAGGNDSIPAMFVEAGTPTHLDMQAVIARRLLLLVAYGRYARRVLEKTNRFNDLHQHQGAFLMKLSAKDPDFSCLGVNTSILLSNPNKSMTNQRLMEHTTSAANYLHDIIVSSSVKFPADFFKFCRDSIIKPLSGAERASVEKIDAMVASHVDKIENIS